MALVLMVPSKFILSVLCCMSNRWWRKACFFEAPSLPWLSVSFIVADAVVVHEAEPPNRTRGRRRGALYVAESRRGVCGPIVLCWASAFCASLVK